MFQSSSFAGTFLARCGLLVKPGFAGVDDGKPESTDGTGFLCLARSGSDAALMLGDCRGVA